MSDCGECRSFLSEFRETVDDARIPVQATCELTYRCNFDCVHCYNVKHWVGGELTVPEWEGIFDQLAVAGCAMITLTGGEPLVHPEFFAIAEAVRERRFALKLLTNASLIDVETADRLAALKPLQVDVSFYGADRGVFAEVTKRGALYDRTYEGVRHLVKRGVRVQAKLPLLRENFEDRFAIEALAKELGCSIKANAEITPKDDGDRSPQAHALTGEQLSTWLRDILPFQKPARAKYGAEDKLCRPGAAALAIGPHGDLYPCIQIKKPMGNLRRQTFREIWDGSPELAEVRSLRAGDFGTCNQCSSFGPCKPCLGVSYLENGTLTGPNSEACRRETTRVLLPILP